MKKSLVPKCLFGRSTGLVIPKKIFASDWLPALFLSLLLGMQAGAAAQTASQGQWSIVLDPNMGLPLLAPIKPIHAALFPSR